MTNKLIPLEIVQSLQKYLATKPWSEVYQVMPILDHLQDAPEIEVVREPITGVEQS